MIGEDPNQKFIEKWPVNRDIIEEILPQLCLLFPCMALRCVRHISLMSKLFNRR